MISVNGFPMPIDVEDGNRIICHVRRVFPERGCPACQGFGQDLIYSSLSQSRQKSLGMSISIGEATPDEQCQSLPRVAAQIPRSSQSRRFQEDQCQQLAAQCCWST